LTASATQSLPRPATGRARRWWLLGAVGALTAAHVYALRLPWDQASPLVLANHLFAVGLLLGLLWLAAALGLRLVRALGLGRALDLESLLFGLGLGLGGVAYLVLACGFQGLLQPWILAALLTVLALGLRAELAELATALSGMVQAWLDQRRELRREPVLRITVPLTEILVGLMALRALAPPTAVDALLYHLAGPKELLQLGRLTPLPDIAQANFPFTVQMLYLLGLSFGSDELPGLLHLAFAVLLAVAAFGAGRRFFSARTGWMAAAALLSAPIAAYYASVPYIDFGWALFDFLAVYAFAVWSQGGPTRWLVIAGLAAGLSLGSKYLGLLTCALIGLGILIEATRLGRIQRIRVARLLALFLVPALIVASPWYLKNWLWLGSPVWPFLVPGPPLEQAVREASDVSEYFVRNMTGGRTMVDYLLLPVRLFLGDAVELPLARPPVLFILAPLYLIVRKHRFITYLLGLTALHIAVWSQGIATLRYLTPTFPAMSLVAAYLLNRMMESARVRGFGRVVGPALVVLSVLLGIGTMVLILGVDRPFAQLIGLESRQAYLSRMLPDYDAVRYLNEHQSEVSKVLVIGDARLFYLEPPAVIDQGLNYAHELQLAGEPRDALAGLQKLGISHVLVSERELVWLIHFDPEQRVQRWWNDFERSRPAYMTAVYSGDRVDVYRVADTIADGSGP
jgi:4-amino-4-deoxy-L-arabinose transferase-like glycosyltransferase